MSFNSQAYLNDQINKQYGEVPLSRYYHNQPEIDVAINEEVIQEIITSDIATLQAMVKQNKVSYVEIAKAFYKQARRHQDSHAVISLNPAVIEEAKTRVYDDSHDPLYGIPVLVKDNIATTNMATTAGAAILKDFYPETDAVIIQELKQKGALILGKTNLSEWANFMTENSANGYSAVGGQTKNPHGSFDVGGSSAGSAVAVALHMSPVAIGTETAGSIIYPASQNGVVGLKPTLKTVAQAGIIPIAAAHDTAGPMAQTVNDCYLLFKAMTTTEATFNDQFQSLADYRFGQLDDAALKETYRDEDAIILATFEEQLQQVGASYQHLSLGNACYDVDITDVLLYQFKAGVESYFKHETIPITLADVIAFNRKDEKNASYYGQDLLEQANNHQLTASAIESVIERNRTVTQAALDEAFKTVDVLVTLSNYATSLYATSGYPALTLPGYQRQTGEPVGITLIAPAGQDVDLLYLGQLIVAAGALSR